MNVYPPTRRRGLYVVASTAVIAGSLLLTSPAFATTPYPTPTPTVSVNPYTGPVVPNKPPLTGKPPVEQQHLPHTLPFTGVPWIDGIAALVGAGLLGAGSALLIGRAVRKHRRA